MTPKPLKLHKIKRLIIRSTNWIGDAIMTTPAMGALRRALPQTEITILSKPWAAAVFENSPHADRIFIYQSDGRHKGLLGKMRLAKDLRGLAFDAAVLFPNSFEAALLTFWAGIPTRIGYGTDGRTLLLTHPIACRPQIKKIHQTRYYLNLLQQVGVQAENGALEIYLSDSERRQAADRLKGYGKGAGEIMVGINPSATFGPAKQWFADRYARLADRVAALTAGRVLIFGGPADAQLGLRIAKMMQHPVINLAGKTKLREAMALINHCRLFISNDSGLMHVAAALGVPVLAIFGSTDPVATGPWSTAARVVRVSLPCSPCKKPQCPEGHLQCMDQIEVGMVLKVVREML